MSSGQFDISIFVRLHDQLTAPARMVQESMQKMAGSLRQAAASAGAGMVGHFNAAFQKIGAAFQKFGSMMRSSWGSLQNNLFSSSIGALGFEQMFEHQLHFQEKIQNIRALRLDREGKATKALREETLKLAMLYPVIGGKLGVAEGAQQLVKMGLSLEDTTRGIDAIARAAAAAHIPVQEAAESIMHTVQSYNIAFRNPLEKAAAFDHVSDAIFAANASFGGTFAGISAAMARGGPAGSQIGLTYDQSAALAGVLTMSGFSPETSGFALSSLFQRAGQFQTSKTGKAVKGLLEAHGMDLSSYYHTRDDFRKFGGAGVADYMKNAVGLDVSSLIPQFNQIANDPFLSSNAENLRSAMVGAINKQLGLDPNDKKMQGDLQFQMGEMLRKTYANMDFLSFIKDLATTGAYRDNELMTKLAGVFQMPKMIDLIMKQLSGDFDERMGTYTHKMTGATRTHLEIWNEGLIGAIKKMAGLWDYFTDELFNGSGFNDSLNKFAKSFLSFSDGLKSVSPDMLWYIAAGLAGLSAATVAGLGIMAVGSALGVLLNPITLVGGALGYLGYELYQARDSFRGFTDALKANFGTAIKAMFSDFGNILRQAYNGDWQKVGEAIGHLLVDIPAKLVPAAVKMAFGIAKVLGETIISIVPKIIGASVDMVDGIVKGVREAIFGPDKAAGYGVSADELKRWSRRHPGIYPGTQADWDTLAHGYVERLVEKNKGLTIGDRMRREDGAAGSTTKMVNSNNTTTNHIAVSVNVANSTQAPAAVGQAVGSSVAARMRGAMQDSAQ